MVIKKATPLKVYERDIQILNHLKASLENVLTQILKSQISYNPVDTGRKLNLHKTFRRRPELTQDVRKTSWTLCTFNLHPVSAGNDPSYQN